MRIIHRLSFIILLRVKPGYVEHALNALQLVHERFEVARVVDVKPDVAFKNTVFRVNRDRPHVDVQFIADDPGNVVDQPHPVGAGEFERVQR